MNRLLRRISLLLLGLSVVASVACAEKRRSGSTGAAADAAPPIVSLDEHHTDFPVVLTSDDAATADASGMGDAASADAALADHASACPDGMVLIEGDYCTQTNWDQRCKKSWYAKWNDKTICLEFEAPITCIGKKEHRRYCVDKYEYPNKAGVRPTVMNNFPQAQRLCADQKKRVCTETEWTMACEGPEYKPYPYGYVRDPAICRGDQSGVEPHSTGHDDAGNQFLAFASKDKKVRAEELERLWQGVPSGSQPKCVSDYGVYDMPGNADELAAAEAPESKFDNVTTGGPWRLGVRNQCRPKIYTHNEGFAYYYLSFRCCAEPDGKPTDPRAPKQIRRNEKWAGGQPPVRDSWDGDPLPDR